MITDLPPGELLRLCIERSSEQIWLEFIRRFQPVIAGSVRRIATQNGYCNPATVEEIIQDVYVKLCDGNRRILREFRDYRDDGLYAFLKVISANVARDRCQAMAAAKRGAGKVVSLSPENTELPSVDAFASRLEYKDFLEKVKVILARCAKGESTARDQSIFWLFYRQDFTAREIAAIPAFELTAKGVESLLRRLVRCVRSALVRTDDGSVPEG